MDVYVLLYNLGRRWRLIALVAVPAPVPPQHFNTSMYRRGSRQLYIYEAVMVMVMKRRFAQRRGWDGDENLIYLGTEVQYLTLR